MKKKFNVIIFEMTPNDYENLGKSIHMSVDPKSPHTIPLFLMILLNSDYSDLSFKKKFSLFSDTKVSDDYCMCFDKLYSTFYSSIKNINDKQTEILFEIPRYGDLIRHFSFNNNNVTDESKINKFEIYTDCKDYNNRKFIGAYDSLCEKIIPDKYFNLISDANPVSNLIIKIDTTDLIYWSKIEISFGYMFIESHTRNKLKTYGPMV